MPIDCDLRSHIVQKLERGFPHGVARAFVWRVLEGKVRGRQIDLNDMNVNIAWKIRSTPNAKDVSYTQVWVIDSAEIAGPQCDHGPKRERQNRYHTTVSHDLLL